MKIKTPRTLPQGIKGPSLPANNSPITQAKPDRIPNTDMAPLD
ncbi:hypothetical protein [Desulfocicer vacuolatum]|nr:hypothetical protein [Desulfocicer vacuolatum]